MSVKGARLSGFANPSRKSRVRPALDAFSGTVAGRGESRPEEVDFVSVFV
jgi:hypothetical protein